MHFWNTKMFHKEPTINVNLPIRNKYCTEIPRLCINYKRRKHEAFIYNINKCIKLQKNSPVVIYPEAYPRDDSVLSFQNL